MIFKSKELVNVPDRGEMPVWSVDTDTQTVTHVHPKTFKTEEHRFFRDYIRYHLHYSEEENPERLQRLVDNGEIFQYLSDLDNKVFDALDSQEELLKANSREFQEAHEKGDIVTEGAIGNLLQQQARESVFEAMIPAQIEIAKRFCKNAHANTPMQPPTINPVNKPIVKYLLLFILLYLP